MPAPTSSPTATPTSAETFDVYEALPDFLAGLEQDQEDLDGYILSAYSYYAMPEGELSGAIERALERSPASRRI